MFTYIKKFINNTLNKFGFKITRIYNKRTDTSPLCAALELLNGTNDRLWIVQIGANDGLINDPIAEFIRVYTHKIFVDLIEPQKELIPFLEQNYSFQQDKRIHNVAVGESSKLILFKVHPAYWKDLDVPYAKNWPDYRAPTGVTSGNKEHVAQWLQKHYKGKDNIDEMIMENEVFCKKLTDILKDPIKPKIDILQIDVEGLDDEVIYNSSIDLYQPRLINFEAHNLTTDKKNKLYLWLEDRGYKVLPYGGDCLAVRTL